MKKIGALFILVPLLGSKANAFDMPIEIDATINDDIGGRLVYFIKDGINKSSFMHITYKNEFRLTLHIVTIDSNGIAPGHATTYSVSWVVSRSNELPIYLTSSAGYCGSDRVHGCADSVVADTYRRAETVHKLKWLYE